MKFDFQKIKQDLKPLIHYVNRGWNEWARLLPKLPDLSWNFFAFEEDRLVFYNSAKSSKIEYVSDVKLLDKTGLWTRIIPWKDAFHQDLKLPFYQASKRRELIPFQMEPLLPFPIDQAELAHLALGPDLAVWVCAVQKKDLILIQEQSSQDALFPDAFVSPLFALMKAHQFFFSQESDPILYAQKEGDRLILALMDHQKIWGMRQVNLTGKTLDLALVEIEARKTLIFLHAPETTKRLWIGVKPQEIEEYDNFKGLKKEDQEAFALIGAKAFMDSASRYEGVISSMQIPLFSKISPWIKGCTWASGALLFALILQTTSHHLQENQNQRRMAQNIIQQAQKQQITLPSLVDFSTIKDWSEETQQFIQNKLSPYPLQADLPSPRDTLGWISDILTSVGDSHITSFEYKSESFPDSKHINARYRVKVELEIEVYDPSVAEAIQQGFLKSYDWIERPSALVWKAQKDRYQVSFYLRDKTRYVQ